MTVENESKLCGMHKNRRKSSDAQLQLLRMRARYVQWLTRTEWTSATMTVQNESKISPMYKNSRM